jgi:hypothetical protein
MQPGDTGQGHIASGSGEGTRDVNCTTIDMLMGPTSRVDFIKIDAEGAELAILEGAASIIATHRPRILLEFSREKSLILDFMEPYYGSRRGFVDHAGQLALCSTEELLKRSEAELLMVYFWPDAVSH